MCLNTDEGGDRKIEYANNSHIRDFKSSSGSVIQNFSGKGLEYTYFLRNKKEMKNFLENIPNHIRGVLEIKKKLKFSKTRANFKFGEQEEISFDVWKKIIDFQAKVFDEITIKLVREDFETMKKAFEYSNNNYEKPISLFLDVGLRNPMLVELINYFKQVTPSNTIWKYRKIDTNIEKYRFISKNLTELNISYSLSECNKRCSIKGFEEISISAVAKTYFGFKDCCMNYPYPKKDKRFPQKKLDKFRLKTYSWGKQDKGDYYSKRLIDFVNLNKIKKSKEEIEKREQLKRLFEHLDKL